MALAARDHQQMTADEFFATTDELPRAQLIDGALVVPMSSPSPQHQMIVVHLLNSFVRFADAHGDAGTVLPSLDIRVDERNVFQPDLLWVPEGTTFDRDVPPPLAIEVLSPSTRRYDLGVKATGYLRAGVEELWTIDPVAAALTVHRPGVEPEVHTGVVTTPLVPGWELDVAALTGG